MRAGFLSVFRERDFRLVWSAAVLSDIGTWMQISALAIYVTDTSSSAAWTGIASTATYLAAGLFTPIGGMLADRVERRRLVIATSFVECAIGIAIAVTFASGIHSPAVLITMAGIQGLATATMVPALTALIPEIVSKERIANASLLSAISWNMGRTLGPVIAVVVVSAFDYGSVFLLNALTFCTTALALYFVHVRSKAEEEDGSITKRLHLGWTGLRQRPICMHATIFATAEMWLVAPFIALIPVMSQLTLEGSKTDSGLLFLGQGIGSAVGLAAMGAVMHRFGIGRAFVWLIATLPPFLFAYALSPTLTWALVVIVPMSAAHSIVLALAISFIQTYAPDNVRGRVLGIHRSVTITSYAIASSLLAVIASEVGLRVTFGATATTLAAFLLWMHFNHVGLHTITAIDSTNQPATELDLTSEEFPVNTRGIRTMTQQ